jgi:hypothetical protein
MMARNTNVPFKGRIQNRKTNHLQIISFGLQRAAGPYSRARSRHCAPMPVHERDPDIMQNPPMPLTAQSSWRFGPPLHLGRWEFPEELGLRRA